MPTSEAALVAGPESARRFVDKMSCRTDGPHAVLFYGPEGAGKTDLAHALAKVWLCLADEGKPCGTCKACGAFGRGNAVDFLRIAPTGPSRIIRVEAITPGRVKSDDAPSFALTEFLRTPPLVAANKVVFIEAIDRLNRAASNALLKTLEEPPARARFVLTTSALSFAAVTIVSRCATLPCELPDAEALRSRSDETLFLAGEGAPGRMARLEPVAPTLAKLRRIAQSLATSQRESALKVSEEFRTCCDELETGLQLNARAANADGLRLLAALMPRSNAFAKNAELIAEAHRRILGNAQATYVLDALFMRMCGRG